MIVEIDIFSGRPNPSWEPGPEEAREFQHRFSTLHRQTAPARTFDGLGYRGLIVRDPGDVNSLTRVGFGTIVQVHGKHEEAYDDEGRSLETWLLSTAHGKIDDRLIAAARDAIAKRP